jgi:hypothetical protein
MTHKHLFTLLFFSGMILPSYSANSIVAHWSFDSLKADTFYNVARDNYHVASPYLQTEEGVLGNALSLSGTSFKPVIRNSSSDFLMSQFSVEAWVMINEDPAVMGRLADQYKILEYSSITSGVYNGFSLCVMGGGKADISLGQSSWVDCTSPEALQIKRWYHLVGTCDGQMLRLYINGKKVNQQPYSGTTIAPEANATIGCQIRKTGETACHFFGLIDELRVYNYALDSSSIVNHYTELNPYKTDPQLIAHWSFDSLKADTFYNVTRDNYHVASPYLQTEKGVLGNALSLSGTSFKPVIRNSSSDFLMSQFSVEAWVMINEDPAVMGRLSNQYKILEYTSIGSYNGWSFCIFGGGRPDITIGQNSWIECTSPESMKPKRWYHLAGTCDGKILRIYINGRKVNQLAYSGTTVPPEANATIGCQVRTTGEAFCHFYGLIDELKLYNGVLDSSSIVKHYTELNPYTTDQRLLAHWSFDSTINQTYFDVTRNGFDATLSKGSASIVNGLKGNSLNCTNDSFLVTVKNSMAAFNVPQFTIEGWIYSSVDLVNPSSFFNSHHIFTTQTWVPGKAEGFEISVDDRGKFHLAMANTAGISWNTCTSDSVLKPRKWYHVAGTYDNQTMKVYVNGRLSGSCTNPGGYCLSHSNAVIGCQMPADSSQWRNWFKGKIDELKFYNYALDAQSIQTIYTQLKPADEPSFEINLGMKTTYAQPGDTVIMPIYITNFEDFSINSCQFSMKYNSSIAELLSVNKDSGIINTWPLFNWNPLSTDSTSIAMAGATTSIAYGEGELVRCVFRVKQSAGIHDTCTISLNNISIDETYHMVTAMSKNGKIIIADNAVIYGDVTGNGEVNIFDAQKVMSFVVGALSLPDSICCPNFTVAVADVSGNGFITSYDAALIFQHSVGLLPEFPVTQTTAKKSLQKRTAFNIPVAQLTTQIENNTTNELKCTIIGSNLKGFVAGEFSIKYDPSIVTLSRGSITTSVRGATLNSRIDQTKQLLKIAIVTNDDIDENSPVPLLSITLPPVQGNTEKAFSIDSASINEGKIPTNWTPTSVKPENFNLHSSINNTFKIITRGNSMMIDVSGNSNITEVTIWTLNGKSILSKKLTCNSSRTSLAINRLPPGSYLYKVKSSKIISKGKFIITY